MGSRVWILCLLGLSLSGALGKQEHAHEGHHKAHDPMGEKMKDGERNKHSDHEAVIGSRHGAEEADELSPEDSEKFLRKLSEKHDIDKDGVITRDEFMGWILESFRRLDEEEALERLKEEDENGDGKLLWNEYLKTQYDFDPEKIEEMKKKPDEEDNKSMLEMVEEDYRRFDAADLDKKDGLDASEYVAFYHPYDYDYMHKFEIERGIKDYDKDKDGVVSMAEFIGDVSDAETEATEKTHFQEFDADGNGKLENLELKKWLIQDNADSAKEEVDHLIETADDDKDGKVTIDEIVNHREDFVSSQATDYGSTLEKMRDEL